MTRVVDSFEDMVSARVALNRLIAVILGIALSTQVVEAQAALCGRMTTQVNMSMTESIPGHQHHNATATSVSKDRESRNNTPGSSSCVQNTFCLSAPATPHVAIAVFEAARPAVLVSFRASVLQSRALLPDFPPPKI